MSWFAKKKSKDYDEQARSWGIRLELLSGDVSSSIDLSVNDEVIVGVDDTDDEVTDISPFFKGISGVSRRHLRISVHDKCLWITDLSSTNGTYKNSVKLEPNTEYFAYTGDVLEAGNLTLLILILKTPETETFPEDGVMVAGLLGQISLLAASNLKLDDALGKMLKVLSTLIDADGSVIVLLDKTDGDLIVKASSGIANQREEYDWKKDESVLNVFETGQLRKDEVPKSKFGALFDTRNGGWINKALPIKSLDEEIIGVLVVHRSSKKKPFSSINESMMMTVARMVALKIRDSQKFEDVTRPIQRRLDELSLVHELSHSLLNTHNLTEMYGNLRELMRHRWKISNVGMWLVDKRSKQLIPFPKPTFHKSYSMGEELIGSVARDQKTVVASDIKLFSEPSDAVEPTLHLLARSALCVPLVESTEVLGVLAVFSTNEDEFVDDDAKLMETIAQTVSTAVRNSLLFVEVDKQRATILAAVNMLHHPMMIINQGGELVLSNNAADKLTLELRSTPLKARDELGDSQTLSLSAFLDELASSKSRTREIVVGSKLYIVTLEFASMVGTIILMQDVTDPVTGVNNRRHFYTMANQAFSHSKRYERPLASLMIGFDEMRGYIENQGYISGNATLKKIISIVENILRTSDILGRYQNEEIVILLPETNLENAKVLADRILNLLKENPIKIEGNKKLSKPGIGIALMDSKKDKFLDDLIAKSYQAFSNAITDPKNRIYVYGDDGE